ncbi:MAG: glycosyltransferase family 4 protein [Bacteroidetes bacterium]|nr:glycosyltransferase family 4 protein [Bacteroidota bacterium]
MQPYTLHIPSWYPSDMHQLNGIFVRKHAEAVSSFRKVVVMYVTGSDRAYSSETQVSDDMVEFTLYYKESTSRALNQIKYIRAQMDAFHYVLSRFGYPELIHLHVIFPAGMFVWLLLLFRRIPLLITEHWTGYMDEDGRYQKLPAIARYISESLLRRARKISVVSAFFKKVIIGKGLVAPDKLVTVYNTLNKPETTYHYTDDKRLKALYVGNILELQKNISALIGAADIVAHTYPAFQLTLVGGGSDLEHFTELCRDNGLLDKTVFFRGFVPNDALVPVYEEHGFFVLSSRFETFNIAAAEAMMSGLPVVSTRCGGPSEFVNEKTGIWIDGDSAEAVAAGILEMIRRRDEFDSQQIAAETQARFSDATILTQLRTLYA